MGKKKKSLIGKVIKFFLGTGLLAGIAVGYFYYSNFMKANISTFGIDTYIIIKRNHNADSVIALLKEKEVLLDESSLKWMMEQKNYQGRNIVAGKYKIEDGLSNNALVNHLRAGNGRLPVYVQFNNVRTHEELASKITRNILIEPQEIERWLSNEDSIKQFGFNKATIISMFIPNTYHVNIDITTPELMRRMAKEWKKFWNEERRAKAKKCNLSPSQVTTLASIVIGETNKKEDMPKIAGVYINRIRKGMPLQADPTLKFALNDFKIKRVLNVHKEIDSPYNTYKYRGLPPGPIAIPPIVYIDAVLDYTKHDYLYFVAKEDRSGYSYFAKTYKQHLIYARRYQNSLNKRKIYK